MQIHMISATFPIYGETNDLVSVDYTNETFGTTIQKCKERLERMFPFTTEWTANDDFGPMHYVLVDEKTRIPLGRIWVPDNEMLPFHTFVKYVGQMREQEDDCDSKFYDIDDF